MSGPQRVFIAFRPPEDLCERVAGKVAKVNDGDPGLRLYAATDLHVTLAFLGEMSPERVLLLGQVMTEELRGVWAPDLRLGDMGAFPDREDPRVVWLGVDELSAQGRLAALASRMHGAALAVGWRPGRGERERAFVPHLTVARRSSGAELPHRSLWNVGFSWRWMPVEVTLFESRPDTPEDRFRPLVSVPLVVGPG